MHNDLKTTAVQMAAFYYSLNMLRLLLSMQLITAEEYDRILKIEAEHYDPQKKLCLVS